MSARVDNIEDDISSILPRASRPDVSEGWVRPRAPQDLAVQDATELLDEYGKDAYWLACACASRSNGALGRHWEAVTMEIERRTGRGSPGASSAGRGAPATPGTGRKTSRKSSPKSPTTARKAAPSKTVGSLRAALDQLAPRNVDFTRLGAYRAGARDDLYEERSYSHGRDRHASQIGAKGFDRYEEDFAEAVRAAQAARDHADDRAAAMGRDEDWRDEELYDDLPRKGRRRGLITALALIGCVVVGSAGAYAYWTNYFGRGSTQTAQSQAQPTQRIAAPAVGANGAVGGYIVQVAARRSKADAEASFRSLQSKFPRQLGGRTATYQRADLGAKGIYYRAMVGPFASAGAADQFCGSLKAAGGECIIQRN
jgi:SPOR domain